MKIFKAENNTAQNESDGILSCLPEEKSSLGARFDKTVEISSLGPLHNQIVVVVVTECVVHAGYEVTFEPLQDIFLQFYVLHQFFLLDLTLLHLFYGIHLPFFLFFVFEVPQVHLAKCPLTQHVKKFEVVQRNFPVLNCFRCFLELLLLILIRILLH